MEELPKAYDPQATEKDIYTLWEKSGFFDPDKLPKSYQLKAKSYSIVMPPPNVTGVLHIGHALGLTIQDILIRYQRMRGKKTLWIPGTDHAAIATQAKVEEQLYKKENKTRRDFSREAFLQLVEQFARDSHDTIVGQIRRLGASCDWSREAYTLDDARSLAVRTAFKTMYDQGLIYRGKRIVNWDPKLQTTVSDEEIEWKDETVPLYYLKYGPFTIATARPETKFGDKYIVVHPDDERYKKYEQGQQLSVEWINGPITATVIKDAAIDMEFGTGAMTITPWHDTADFDIAARHQLVFEQIIDETGKLLPIAGEFAGAHIKKARPLVVEKLQGKGLVEKIDEQYAHRLATNSRGGGIIEPQVKEQWFVAVNTEFTLSHSTIDGIASGEKVTLKKLMRHAVESGQIKIIPDHFQKTYFHWIDNLRDWCISRQIIFGHRIPVWYKGGETFVGIEAPVGDGWTQDPDTLDTWFSSGLWTFSTLTKSGDRETFHPTDVLETGYDILFFWVARMILMTTCLLGEIPFRTVYLHGLVRDKDRQKMSKSKGNSIDPLGVIDAYGTDALRFALIFSTAAGSDIPLAEEKIKGMKHFANKLWNIARFILANVAESAFAGSNSPQPITEADTAILKKLGETVVSVTSHLEDFKFHEAAQTAYHFVWHELADVYLEASKAQLQNADQKETTEKILAHCLVTTLKLLHPFMPFITETIWQKIPHQSTFSSLLMVEKWPQ